VKTPFAVVGVGASVVVGVVAFAVVVVVASVVAPVLLGASAAEVQSVLGFESPCPQ
jgi:hypothetical protein